jgi:hypothetical protein
MRNEDFQKTVNHAKTNPKTNRCCRSAGMEPESLQEEAQGWSWAFTSDIFKSPISQDWKTMMKHLVIIAMLFMVASMASGTMWIAQEPDYLQIGTQFTTPFFKPTNLSPFEIINATYFPLLGEGFYTNAAPVTSKSSQPTVEIKSNGTVQFTPPLMEFSGNLENNLKYATAKSSFRIGQGNGSATLNAPWMIK